MISKKQYETLKWISLVLPVIITAIIGFQELYGFTPLIAQSLGIIEAALLSFLKIESHEYFSDKEIVDKSKNGTDVLG